MSNVICAGFRREDVDSDKVFEVPRDAHVIDDVRVRVDAMDVNKA